MPNKYKTVYLFTGMLDGRYICNSLYTFSHFYIFIYRQIRYAHEMNTSREYKNKKETLTLASNFNGNPFL